MSQVLEESSLRLSNLLTNIKKQQKTLQKPTRVIAQSAYTPETRSLYFCLWDASKPGLVSPIMCYQTPAPARLDSKDLECLAFCEGAQLAQAAFNLDEKQAEMLYFAGTIFSWKFIAGYTGPPHMKTHLATLREKNLLPYFHSAKRVSGKFFLELSLPTPDAPKVTFVQAELQQLLSASTAALHSLAHPCQDWWEYFEYCKIDPTHSRHDFEASRRACCLPECKTPHFFRDFKSLGAHLAKAFRSFSPPQRAEVANQRWFKETHCFLCDCGMMVTQLRAGTHRGCTLTPAKENQDPHPAERQAQVKSRLPTDLSVPLWEKWKGLNIQWDQMNLANLRGVPFKLPFKANNQDLTNLAKTVFQACGQAYLDDIPQPLHFFEALLLFSPRLTPNTANWR
jgi:hypothetical protein